MIIPGGATHAYSQYHHFHLNFNRRIKTAAVALALLEAEWSAGRTDEAIRDAANICGGWPDWSDKNAALRDARFDLGACGVVKVFSALDVLVRCSSIRARSARVKALVVPEHQRFSTRSDRTRESPWTVSDVQW